MSAADITFLDTETLGLDPNAPVWEFAAIRRNGVTGEEQRFHCFIDHDPEPWLGEMPERFRGDYLGRYVAEQAISRHDAAAMVFAATEGAYVVGAVPSFDTVRLGMLLSSVYFDPEPWHYHLVDVENVIVGFLAGTGEMLLPPYDSNELSKAVGVNPQQYERHTAMGDVLWVRAQFDAVTEASKAAA
jgi:hypothetical protein